MSHAEARGAGNGNFWAALFIPRSSYNPSLPSPLSGGKFKPQLVSPGLAGGAWAVLAAGWPGHEASSGGSCHRPPGQGGSARSSAVGAAAHPAPRHLAGAGGGGAAHLCRGFVRLVCLASPGDVQWVPSAGGWGGVMGSALVPWWARGLWAGTQAARVLWQAGGCSGDTGSPGDAQPRPSSNCSLTSQHAGWGSAGPQ